MKRLTLFFILIGCAAFGQDTIRPVFIKSQPIKAEIIGGFDKFDNFYYTTKNNSFFKQDASHISSVTNISSFSNVQLGDIASVDIFNPLKINLFYKDLNSFIILDNRLADVFKIDFNTVQPYRNVTHISTGFDNTVWLFNMDSQQLELYDYKQNRSRFRSVPINGKILDLKSNFNFCWLLTQNYLYQYNYLGSMISKIPNNGFENIAISNENLIVLKSGKLYRMDKDLSDSQPIKLPNLLIKQFFATTETLYIYDGENLHHYQLKLD